MTINKLAVCSGALLALVGTSALAVPGLTNTNQKGSLLVFPEIDTSERRDTIIFLSNDNNEESVYVKCYYGEFYGRDPYTKKDDDTSAGYPKPTQDFVFKLTPGQPVLWRASNGLGAPKSLPNFPNEYTGTGQLICWAVEAGGSKQIKFNHLSGMAKIVQRPLLDEGGFEIDDTGQSWEYSAYAFYCNGGGITGRAMNGDPCGTDPFGLDDPDFPLRGVLELDEKAYDKCGRYIIGQMIPQGAGDKLGDALYGTNRNYLSISSCTQDLYPIGHARYLPQDLQFEVWNEDEVKYTGAVEYHADSWWRFQLCDPRDSADIPCAGFDLNSHLYDTIDRNPGKVTYDELKTKVAHYRVESLRGYGLIGVQVQFHRQVGYSATTVRHAGRRDGLIYWRANYIFTPERQ